MYPVETAKFMVSDAVAVPWESVLRHDSFAAFARRLPEQLIRWEGRLRPDAAGLRSGGEGRRKRDRWMSPSKFEI